MTFRSTAMSAGHKSNVAARIVFLALALSLISLPSLAQSTAGRVLGTIADQSGASVAGATVVATTVGALVTTGGAVVGAWIGINVVALPAL